MTYIMGIFPHNMDMVHYSGEILAVRLIRVQSHYNLYACSILIRICVVDLLQDQPLDLQVRKSPSMRENSRRTPHVALSNKEILHSRSNVDSRAYVGTNM